MILSNVLKNQKQNNLNKTHWLFRLKHVVTVSTKFVNNKNSIFTTKKELLRSKFYVLNKNCGNHNIKGLASKSLISLDIMFSK